MLSSNPPANNSKRFFTPIVASSLALFLSAGIANAAALDCSKLGSSQDPRMCYEFNQIEYYKGTLTLANLGLTWTPTADPNIVKPQSGSTDISQLIFRFAEGTGTPTGAAGQGGAFTISYGGTGLKQLYIFDGGTKGIEMADQVDGNRGKLTLIYGRGVAKREFQLNLSKSTGDFSFKGNIEIQAGEGYPTHTLKNSRFVADFGKDMIGDVIVTKRDETSDQRGHTTALDFHDSASMQGSITTKAGMTTATFAEGNLMGDVIAEDFDIDKTRANNVLSFSGQDNRIEGNIKAASGGTRGFGGNIINFANNGTIEGTLSASQGVNEVETGGTLALTGDVITSGDSAGGNVISAENMVVSGSIKVEGDANSNNQNKISATQNLTLNADAISVALDALAAADNGNKITSMTEANITAQMISAAYGQNLLAAANLTLQAGTIEANGAQGDITASKNDIVAVSGNVTAENVTAGKGTNAITMQGGSVSVTNTLDANEGKNIIALSGQDTSITANTITANNSGSNALSLQAGAIKVGTATADNHGINTFELNGQSSSLTAESITAQISGTNTIELKGQDGSVEVGTLGADNGTNTTTAVESATITATNLLADNAGTNTFTLQQGGSFNSDSIMAQNTGTNTFELNSGQSTLTLGDMAANNGTNTITAANTTDTTTINATTITAANMGTNTITLNGADSSLEVGTLSSDGGTNTITATAAATLKATTISAENAGKNTLTLQQGGNLTAESISANGGTNNIDFMGAQGGSDSFDAKKITSSSDGVNNILLKDVVTSSSNITAEVGGKNHIVLRNTAASSEASKHDITNNGGTIALALQNANLQSNIGYGNSGETTLLLANGDDGAADGFEATETDITADKILGKVYQDGVRLTLRDKKILVDGKASSLVETYGKDFVGEGGTSFLMLKVEDTTTGTASTKTLTITGLASGDITALAQSTGGTTPTTKLILNEDSAFVGNLNLIDTTNNNASLLKVEMNQGSKLLLEGDETKLKTLTFNAAKIDASQFPIASLEQSNSVVDLATIARADSKHFRLLEIGDSTGNAQDSGLKGENALFKITLTKSDSASGNTLGGEAAADSTGTYGYAYSDRILVHNVLDANGATPTTPLTQYLAINPVDMSAEDMKKIKYTDGGGTKTAGNIAVFTTKNDASGQALVNLKTQGASLVGYDVVETKLTEAIKTDDKGVITQGGGVGGTQGGYSTYFIDSMGNKGASKANQLSAITALSNNYMLYLANLNSLNKRMGELRENTASQGAWLRIFNGMQSTNFKEMLDSRAIYTTIQAGYDYTFGFKGASNYLGFALSYANALGSSEGFRDINGIDKGLKNMNSNAFELAIYNAYVQDGASKATGFKNGLYSDSIAKFSYILGSYNFLDQSNKTYDTSNFAFTLSQELGYRFLLGADKEFYIDPQAEFAFGFFSNSNLAQSMGNNFFLKAMQDSILTLRSRVGSSFGYKFDKFTQNKGFSSSLYLGTYFVSDVILGGEVSINTNANKPLEIKPLTSDMRFVLNLGTNFKIKDNTRIYFDFERSFGGKITTDYQLNLGVRYSFGTSKYTPYTEANTQEIKDNNTLKEVEPTKGYYIELLEKEDKKLSSKELKTLQNLKEELRIQTKTQNNKTLKAYLAGPFKDESKAKEAKTKLEGVIKELKGKGSVVEVE